MVVSEQPVMNTADPVRIAMANRAMELAESYITMGAWPSRRGAEATNLAKRGHEIPLGQVVTFKTNQYGGGKINEKNHIFLWNSKFSLVNFRASFWPTGRRRPLEKEVLRPKNQFFNSWQLRKKSPKKQ